MTNRILLEVLEDKRVQKLLSLAFTQITGNCCITPEEVVVQLREKLRPKTRAAKYKQTELNLK